MNRTLRSAAVCIAGLAVSHPVRHADAGPLNPPAGAIASTAKPLAEIEPRTAINAANTPGDADSLYRITQPGSYYLTGNINGVPARHGIEIASHGVTIDLNGFELAGVPGSLSGVQVAVASLRNIVVVNGTVRHWGGDGVYTGTAATGRAERLTIWANGDDGLAAGSGFVVSQVAAHDNAGLGISTGSGSSITGCSAMSNDSNGIAAGSGSAVSGCSAYGNGGNGISGGSECSITGCAAGDNTARGFLVSANCTVTACTAGGNGSDGIRCSSGSHIHGNTCMANGIDEGDGAGIRATQGDNRIEGNHCTGNDRGIDVDIRGNVIIRNTCAGNGVEYTIAADNIYGPIIDRRIPATVASTPSVNGAAAPGTMGSADPNANYAH
ncbi:MAG TPA: right-handed parallel beta-helix repeat-containing protein [Phycisphaerales bacterium]|nr:right-handed parallel beta-helix repeat-containing protein [Phycisphaerales bacterium]